MGGKVVLSKVTCAIITIVVILIIVAVGLLAGLLGKTTTVVEYATTTTTMMATSNTTSFTDTTGNPLAGPWKDIRLPPFLVPYHYMVDLQPNLEPDINGKYEFNGTSNAHFHVVNTTKFIYIHSNKLDYDEVVVLDKDNNEVPITQHWLYNVNQYLIVEMQEGLVEGVNYTLHTKFVGELADDLTGLYRSTYTNSHGDEVIIAVSQMQPTDARKSFPCFDEPALKATFDIFLWHKDPNFALSNMPFVMTTDQYEGWKRTEFQRTFRMSTYLLAFVVSEFGYEHSSTAGTPSIQTRIYARPEQVINKNVEYAKNITPTILEYYETYFEVAYPLPKSDQIAIPDFALGGMENWGLVMYRETALLYNAAINSAYNKQRVANVIAHELTHQWFGDLITPLWWDELWLNEGFASFIEYVGTEHVEPSWRMMDQFVLIDLHDALAVDALTTSRPIVAENIETPDDINGLFDDISYSKGACIIRMIHQFTGEEAFKLGLKNYLKQFAYGPVDHNQLFTYWENAILATQGSTNPPGGFVAAMDTWVLQMGYPVVNMTRDKDVPNRASVQQQRFLLDPQADITQPYSPLNYIWEVPVWYIVEGVEGIKLEWLNTHNDFQFTVSEDSYFIGNYGAYGYYRVNYDEENWYRILNQLSVNFTVIDVKSRSQLIDDSLTLARAGQLKYEIALETTKFLRNDSDYLPWKSSLNVFKYFDQMLGRSKVYGVYSDYMMYLVEPVYNNTSSTPEGHVEKLKQGIIMDTACSYGSVECVSNAENLFHAWMNVPTSNLISPDLRTVVYCQAVANGGSPEWNFVWERYQVEGDSNEKRALQNALSCSKESWIVQRFLEYTLDVNLVRKQDASAMYVSLCDNEYARDLTWDFLRKEWDYIYDVYGSGFFSFSSIIESCTSHFSTDFELQELEIFKESRSDQLGSGARAVDQALEKTKTNIKWRADHEDTIFNWLTDTMATVAK
ncbi:aminopeptidase N [Ciona intestinalis]